ncbi:MAG: hypothetical protein V4726_00155 [Verrucomicrobiota bacterium]
MRSSLPFLLMVGIAGVLSARNAEVNSVPSFSIPEAADDPAAADPPPSAPTPAVEPEKSGKPGAPVIATRILDPQSVIAIPTAPGITTTLQFPEAIQGIDGVGLSSKAEDGVLYTISHSPGTSILSFSPTSPEARTNINVVVHGQVYVFVLAVNPDTALFKLTLENPPPPPPDPQAFPAPPEHRQSLGVSPTKLMGLMDKCKAYAALRHDSPAHVADIRQGKGPWKPTVLDGAVITPMEIYRKGEWDALVMRLSIRNPSRTPLFYDPESLLAGVGPQSFRPVLTDASGRVGPNSQDEAWMVIQGDGAQGTNNLDTDNEFQISFQKVAEGQITSPPGTADASLFSGK